MTQAPISAIGHGKLANKPADEREGRHTKPGGTST